MVGLDKRDWLEGDKLGSYHIIKALDVQDPRKEGGNESLPVVRQEFVKLISYGQSGRWNLPDDEI